MALEGWKNGIVELEWWNGGMMVSLEANDVALPPEKFIAKIWQERRRFVREGRIKQPHPWQVALSQGKVSETCLLYTSPSPRDRQKSRMPSSA